MGRTTNVARRRAGADSARARAAAAREAAAQREQRRRRLVVVGSTLGVIAVIAVIAVIGANSAKPKGDHTRSLAAASVVDSVTGVPAATLAAVGAGSVTSVPKAVTGPALSSGGHPEVLFIGAEYCPYCAAERWPLVQALSRFGTFSALSTVHSASNDVYPNTATFSFHGASYSSDTLTFVPREDEDTTGKLLDKPTSAESALWKKYTGQGSFPFLDIGGRYVVRTPSYDPAVLKGLTVAQIAQQLATPSSKVARAVDGAANVITAAICRTTSNAPSSVCTAPGVVAAAQKLGS
jgi:hypothetical protein